MDQTEDFENFYSNKIIPHVANLKAEVKAADSWGNWSLAFGALAALCFFGWMGHSFRPMSGWFIFIFIAALIFSFIKYTNKNDVYTDDFKSTVINETIKHLNPDMQYKPGKCVTEKEYKTSGLFRTYYDNFYGDDFMSGTYKNVYFRCSEIGTETENSSIIFKGLFFIAKLNSGLIGGTYIWSKNFEQLPASIMDEEYRLMPMPKVVRVHISDTSFNKYFSVCTNYSAQASEILTQERIQQIVAFKEKILGDMAFSFVDGHCYVALGAVEDLFEPSGYQPDDRDEIMKYYYTVSTILNIIDQLSLNELI